jgi:hypothetical protein
MDGDHGFCQHFGLRGATNIGRDHWHDQGERLA